jgi:hypothetical protein
LSKTGCQSGGHHREDKQRCFQFSIVTHDLFRAVIVLKDNQPPVAPFPQTVNAESDSSA